MGVDEMWIVFMVSQSKFDNSIACYCKIRTLYKAT